MYGNVDAAIKFFKTLTAHITKDEDLQLKQSKTDPCVFYKLDFNNNLILIVSVTVDDCGITGKNKDIDWFMDGLEKNLKLQEMEFYPSIWEYITNGVRLLKVNITVKQRWRRKLMLP